MYLLSVEENIARLLSTTKGSLVLAPQVGLSPIFIDRVALEDDLLLDLKDEILENLEHFEPRITEENLSIEQSGAEVLLHVRAVQTDMSVKL
ncbi:GPW/gp25 family protein [Helicobacter cynogastricus]|uniref:GPW/gp25 family protein n=1 Tax=Helicobacter cynogastricus TaxID=329937 RepID=UPI000CF163C5|nr:GPW/gp25 family protein [Helicobacter cynogastricus]